MKSTRLLFAAVCSIGGLSVYAQEDASRIEKRFEKPPEPKSSLQPLIFPIDERQPPEKAGEIKFVLKELRLAGNTAFAGVDLAPMWAELIGREISLLDIYKLRDAITAKYGNAGFGLTKALIPEQRIQAEGVVRIEILEGFIDEVIVESQSDEIRGEAREYLDYAIARIKAERPANARTLERYLLLANDRYGIKLTSTLKKSEKTPGASTLILMLEAAPTVEGSTNFDNRGTSAVGPTQINANATFNGVLGRPSQATLSYATVAQAKELQYFSIGYAEVIAHEGTALALNWSGSKSEPGTPALRQLENTSDSNTWSLKLTHPYIRTRQENLSAHIKYEQKDTVSKSLGAVTSQDKLRTLRTGINYDRADTYDGINQALVEFSVGLRGMGATANSDTLKSRSDGRFDYSKLTVTLSRKQELGYLSSDLARFSLNASLMGQYSGSGLLSSEECGVGGQQYGRAYDSSEIVGDSCLAASLELRYAIATEGSPFKYAQAYGFWDGGSVRNVNPVSAADPITKSLASSGLGIRFGLGDYVTGSVEVAQPLNRIVANKGNESARVFANVSVRF